MLTCHFCWKKSTEYSESSVLGSASHLVMTQTTSTKQVTFLVSKSRTHKLDAFWGTLNSRSRLEKILMWYTKDNPVLFLIHAIFEILISISKEFKMVLQGSLRSDLSEYHRLYEYVPTLRPLMGAKNLLPPISLTVLTLPPKISVRSVEDHLNYSSIVHTIHAINAWNQPKTLQRLTG